MARKYDDDEELYEVPEEDNKTPEEMAAPEIAPAPSTSYESKEIQKITWQLEQIKRLNEGVGNELKVAGNLVGLFEKKMEELREWMKVSNDKNIEFLHSMNFSIKDEDLRRIQHAFFETEKAVFVDLAKKVEEILREREERTKELSKKIFDQEEARIKALMEVSEKRLAVMEQKAAALESTIKEKDKGVKLTYGQFHYAVLLMTVSILWGSWGVAMHLKTTTQIDYWLWIFAFAICSNVFFFVAKWIIAWAKKKPE